jgi:dolichol-phosphate mannosyltransferase
MISIVVPTYKERANISSLVERVGAAMAACGEDFELIIVDDDSPDGTAEEVKRLQAERPWLRLLVRRYERDLSTAVIAGWRIAKGDVLGCIDADLQHPPETLLKLLQKMRETGAEVVVGSRHVKGGGVSEWSLFRRFISWTATLMATFILPGTLGKVRDPMSGFFLLKRNVIARAVLRPVGYKILLEALARGDYDRVEEVPYVFEEREFGGSKIGPSTVFYYIVHLITLSFETREAVRIGKYALVGMVGALWNFLVTLFFFEDVLHWPWGLAVTGGVGVAMVHNFLWNDFFTFWETRRAQPGLSNMLRRFGTFVIVSVTGALLHVGIFGTLAGALELPHAVSLFSAIACAGGYNFFVNSNLTWRAWWNHRLLSRASAREPAPVQAFANGNSGDVAIVACNLCGSEHFGVLYAGNARRQSRVSAETFRCTSEQHGDFTNIVQCSECGLLYENPREVENSIELQYQQVEDPTYLREESARVHTFSKLLDRLASFSPTPGRALDVGCYTGVFLDVARERGWQTSGVEPSIWAARIARQKGHTVINAPLREAGLAGESFDLVTVWDVIEHLHDPKSELRHAHRLLKPGGILALSTMNADALFAKVMGRHWPWYMRMHLYYFTPATMQRMLQDAGFELLAVERHKRVSSLRYLLEKAGAMLGKLAVVGRIVGKPFGSAFLTIDLGDIMNVYARKSSGEMPATK